MKQNWISELAPARDVCWRNHSNKVRFLYYWKWEFF